MTKFSKVISIWANISCTFLFQLTCWLYIQRELFEERYCFTLGIVLPKLDMIPKYLIEKLEKISLIQVFSNGCGMRVNKKDRKQLTIQIPFKRQNVIQSSTPTLLEAPRT